MTKVKKTKRGLYTTLAYGGKDDNGKKVYKRFSGSDKHSVVIEAAQYEEKSKMDKQDMSNASMLFSEAAEGYISSKSNILSPSTIRGYYGILNNALPMLTDKPIKDIVSGDLIQRQINANTKKYSSKSVHNQNGFISAVLRHYKIKTGIISLPPKQYVKVPVPTETNAKEICAYLRECPRIECQALLALTCSLRQSEIAALTASDINGNDVFVHGARILDKNNNLVYNPFGKSDAATRHVQMPKYLEAQVEKWKSERPDGWLFPTTPQQVLYYFEKMERAHGMPPFTMHSLRHCFAAVMHALNVPDQYIMQLGGWKSDFVLKRVYRYALEEKTAKVKNNANIYFSKMMHK